MSVKEKGATLLGRSLVPVEMTVLRDGTTVSRYTGSDTSEYGWHFLCEEVEAEYPPEKRDGKGRG